MNNKRNIENKKRPKKEGKETKQREETFDKKKYRLQKYSNKYKINQWEERRKKAIQRDFYKNLKEDQRNFVLADSNNASNDTDKTSNSKKGYAVYKAKQESQRRKEKKVKEIQEAMQKKTERENALKQYKEKKLRTIKVLSQKTKKGQPVMKGRIEMLLAKIQHNPTLYL